MRLPIFEGPLDLLLHLIRKNELDIQEVRLEEMTQQYMEYLDLMQLLDLEIAGEFLVVASTLLWIKSRSLLPADPGAEEEASEEGGDPRLDLIRQLVEYRRFKDVSERLQALQWERSDVALRGMGESAAEFLSEKARPLEKIGLFDIMDAFRRVLKGAEERDLSREIDGPRFTLHDRIDMILSALDQTARISFQELFQDARFRDEIVVSFLALLELIRLQRVTVLQEHAFGTIMVVARKKCEDGGQVDG